MGWIQKLKNNPMHSSGQELRQRSMANPKTGLAAKASWQELRLNN
jgi:hypothetical protein